MSDKLAAFVKSFPWVEAVDVPWARPLASLEEAKVGLITTGGIYVEGDTPFAIETREDVDESHREIPLAAPVSSLRIAHEHYNKMYAQKDLNSVFPVERLAQMAEGGLIGGVSPVNFSITGYIPRPRDIYATGRAIAERLGELEVDAALITPV